MSEKLYATAIQKLLKPGYREPAAARHEAGKKIAKLFGVEHNPLKRQFHWRSKLLTREHIAQTLLDNSLVESLEEGLKETDILLKRGTIANTKFVEYESTSGEKAYELEFDPPFAASTTFPPDLIEMFLHSLRKRGQLRNNP